MPSTPYERGTKTVRITTARVRAGDRLVTATDLSASGRTDPRTPLTGSTVRTVARVEHGIPVGGRRGGLRYRVTFDDGVTAWPLVGHQTWALVQEWTTVPVQQAHGFDGAGSVQP